MRAAPLGMLLLLGACNAPDKADRQPDAATSSTPAAAPSPAAVARTAAPAPEQAAQRVVLDSGGLSVGGTKAAFGTDRATVDARIAAALGQPVERSDLGECGAGAMDFSKIGGLTLNYQEGKLLGWFAREGSGLVTSDGIRPGITIADLKRERSVKLLDTTLDGEFEYYAPDGSTMSGFAEGKGDQATITGLYAGTQCFIR